MSCDWLPEEGRTVFMMLITVSVNNKKLNKNNDKNNG